jgi:hypothetical protein
MSRPLRVCRSLTAAFWIRVTKLPVCATTPGRPGCLSRLVPLRRCAHIARIRLEHANGFHVAETGARVHRTVWGRPLQLLACVADILPVGAQ